MDINWTIAFGGALGGALVTNFASYLFNYQKRKWDKQDLDKKTKEEHIESEFKVYNEVLKADGDFHFVTMGESGLNEFRLKEYKELVRPILYRDFHKLDPDVRNIVRRLDDKISGLDYYNTVEEWLDEISGEYNQLIEEIENRYFEYEQK